MSTVQQSVIVGVVSFLAGALVVTTRRRGVTRRAPGFKPWRMSKWIAHNGVAFCKLDPGLKAPGFKSST